MAIWFNIVFVQTFFYSASNLSLICNFTPNFVKLKIANLCIAYYLNANIYSSSRLRSMDTYNIQYLHRILKTGPCHTSIVAQTSDIGVTTFWVQDKLWWTKSRWNLLLLRSKSDFIPILCHGLYTKRADPFFIWTWTISSNFAKMLLN